MNYTAKQWQTAPENLPASIVSRLPVRYTYNNRYFNDTYEGLPTDGYGAWLTRMVDNPLITVYTDTDFFDDSHEYSKSKVVGKIPVVYTGPVSRWAWAVTSSPVSPSPRVAARTSRPSS